VWLLGRSPGFQIDALFVLPHIKYEWIPIKENSLVTVAGPLGTFTRFPVTLYGSTPIKAPNANNMKFSDNDELSSLIITKREVKKKSTK